MVLILNTLRVDDKFLNSIKFLFRLMLFAVNITFFNDGQQINGSTAELWAIKLFDKLIVFRLTNGIWYTW